MNKKLVTLLLASTLLLGGCVNIKPNDVENEPEKMTSQETVEQPAPESTLNESTLNESRGLAFRSAENNTCYVTGLGNCTDRSIVIPSTSPNGETVVGIAEEAFYRWATIESVKLPDTVKSIGDYAFEFCTSLEWIHLPENLETIGEGAFSHCSSLKHLEIPEQVIFPNGTDSLFSGCNSLESVRLPANVEQIGEWCFSFCESLKSIVIPSSVTQIGEGAFARCPRLDSLTVEEGNTTFISKDGCVIERSTKTLVAITPDAQIPSDGSVEALGDGALSGQDRTEITIPAGVKMIGKRVFTANDELEFISIPHSVEKIDEKAFADCWSTETIHYNGTVAEWKQLTPNDSWMTWTEKFTVQCTDGEIRITCSDPAIG